MEVTIGYRTVLSIEVRTEAALAVGRGRLWLTREGAAGDLLVGRGESAALREGRWLVQALAPASFSCEDTA
jgi:hypothetical protein